MMFTLILLRDSKMNWSIFLKKGIKTRTPNRDQFQTHRVVLLVILNAVFLDNLITFRVISLVVVGKAFLKMNKRIRSANFD